MAGPPVWPYQTLGVYGPRHSSDIIVGSVFNPIPMGLSDLKLAIPGIVIALNWFRITISNGTYNDPAGLLPAIVNMKIGYDQGGVLSDEHISVSVIDVPAAAPAIPSGLLYDSGIIGFGENIFPTPLDPGFENTDLAIVLTDELASGIAALNGFMSMNLGISLIKV